MFEVSFVVVVVVVVAGVVVVLVSMKPELPSFVSSDVMLLLDEIEHTRNTLAEIQALRLEAGQAKGDTYTKPSEEEVNFDSLTSKQWLEVIIFLLIVCHKMDCDSIDGFIDSWTQSKKASSY